MPEVEEIRDLTVEAANARDVELVRRLASSPEKTEKLVASLRVMNERWPRLMMTHADVAGRPVAGIWLPDRIERYVLVGHVEFSSDDDAASMRVVGGVDPRLVAESPPGREVAEWESFSQQDTGQGHRV